MSASDRAPGLGDTEGREWLAAMPGELEKQRALLARLLDHCATTPEVSSLSVGCSLGRGAGDSLSDVDVALGVDAPPGKLGAEQVLAAEASALDACVTGRAPVDVLRDRVGTSDRFVRRVFVQFVDGVQLDLAIMAESEVRRGEAAPDFVSLYLSSTPAQQSKESGEMRFPSAYTATSEQVYEWTFLGWVALADLTKYLTRGSLWEAHQRLHEARDRVWALWAVAQGATYPWHGLSQVLDHDPDELPPGIERTLARLEHKDLLRAARSTAEVLGSVSRLAAARTQASVPVAMAGYVTTRLHETV